MSKKFVIRANLKVVLTADDIWPDGDAPENPTAQDVAQRIDDDGGFRAVLDDWNLRDSLVATVSEEGPKEVLVEL